MKDVIVSIIITGLIMYIILVCLTACKVYAGLGVHDPSFDDKFKEGVLLGTVGGELPFGENAALYIEHTSNPTTNNDKTGITHAGGRVSLELFK